MNNTKGCGCSGGQAKQPVKPRTYTPPAQTGSIRRVPQASPARKVQPKSK